MATIGAVVLAAGASCRFGKPKQLAVFRGAILIRHATDAAISAGCDPVVVVTGEQHSAIERELAGTNCQTTLNPNWREGMAASIRCGLQNLMTLDRNVDAVLLLSCDQPLVDAEMLRCLIQLRAHSSKAVVACRYQDTVGIPALFDRAYFSRLLELRGDRGAKDLLLTAGDALAVCDCPAAAIDLDTMADLERLGG